MRRHVDVQVPGEEEFQRPKPGRQRRALGPECYVSISGPPADARTEESCTAFDAWNTPPHACDLFTLK
jgi:hypothetical protein